MRGGKNRWHELTPIHAAWAISVWGRLKYFEANHGTQLTRSGFKSVASSKNWNRALVLLFATSLGPLAADPAPTPPVLLDAAFNGFIEHQGRWAYTETHSGLNDGAKIKEETIVRVDPSQPYAQQRVPSADRLEQRKRVLVRRVKRNFIFKFSTNSSFRSSAVRPCWRRTTPP